MNGPFLTSFLALSLLSTPLYAADMTAADVSTANSSSQNKGTLDDSNSDDLSPPAPATIDNNISIIENSETLAQSPAQNPVQRKTSLTELTQLIEQSKFPLAYQLGLTMHEEWEGDEQFDFNFALAASQTGHYNQAIFAFERLLDAHPNNLRFRLEMARCYYFLNNHEAAKREFTTVAEANPPSAVQNQIDHFLDRIADQQHKVTQSWKAGVGLALGHDTNINAAADIDSINATFYDANNVPALTGTLLLDNKQKSQASNYYQLQAFGSITQPLSKRTHLDASLSVSQKDNFVNNDYDLSNLSANGGITILRDQHSLRLGGVARQYWLAGETLQNQLLANVRWQWFFAPAWKASTELELGQQNNNQNDALNFGQWQGKFSMLRHYEQGFVHSLQLSLGSNTAKDKKYNFQGSDYYSLGYQAQQKLTANQQLYAQASYRNNHYAAKFADNDLFYAGKQRSDNIAQLAVGWLYNVQPATTFRLQVNHSNNQSNLELYDYQRTLIEAGLTLAFK